MANFGLSGKSPAVQRCPQVSTRVQRCPGLSRPVHGRPWTQAGSLRRHLKGLGACSPTKSCRGSEGSVISVRLPDAPDAWSFSARLGVWKRRLGVWK
eukprot:358551-Chlamydomonas_euryale.AAC.1